MLFRTTHPPGLYCTLHQREEGRRGEREREREQERERERGGGGGIARPQKGALERRGRGDVFLTAWWWE